MADDYSFADRPVCTDCQASVDKRYAISVQQNVVDNGR